MYASVSLIPHKATRFLTAEELYLHLFKKKKRNESHSVNRSMHSVHQMQAPMAQVHCQEAIFRGIEA